MEGIQEEEGHEFDFGADADVDGLDALGDLVAALGDLVEFRGSYQQF
jgi:hypothetical protein